MFELFEMWRNSRADPKNFLSRVMFYTVDGTKIGTSSDWLSYAGFWVAERDRLKHEIDAVGWSNAGVETIKQYKYIATFADNIADILALFADALQPRTFEDFFAYGFSDQPVS